MPSLRCTQNLLKKLKVSPSLAEDSSDSILGDWYANVFRISRKQCVIFVNEKTLFSFIIHGVSIKPKPLVDAFLSQLSFVLIEEGIQPDLVQQICLEYRGVGFAKTNSRSIIGSMNDLVFLYRHSVEFRGGLEQCDMSNLIRDMNRTPQVNLDLTYSIREVKCILGIEQNDGFVEF